jgi:hypothetical protein
MKPQPKCERASSLTRALTGLGEVPLPSLSLPSFSGAHLDLIRRHRPQVVSAFGAATSRSTVRLTLAISSGDTCAIGPAKV